MLNETCGKRDASGLKHGNIHSFSNFLLDAYRPWDVLFVAVFTRRAPYGSAAGFGADTAVFVHVGMALALLGALPCGSMRRWPVQRHSQMRDAAWWS